MWHGILIWLGGTNPSGTAYLLWSGAGSDITELGILISILAWYQHRKCKTCFRIGRYQVYGTPYKTCHKHLTMDCHMQLSSEHKAKHPEQHSFLRSIHDHGTH